MSADLKDQKRTARLLELACLRIFRRQPFTRAQRAVFADCQKRGVLPAHRVPVGEDAGKVVWTFVPERPL